MVGLKEICALLVAGSMGAGSVVAVQQAKAPQPKAKAKPTQTKTGKLHPRIAAPTALAPSDCPTGLGKAGPWAEIAPPGANETWAAWAKSEGAMAGSNPEAGPPAILNPWAPPIAPAPPALGGIPEPASWAMMIAGFGLIGCAMRRRKAVVQ